MSLVDQIRHAAIARDLGPAKPLQPPRSWPELLQRIQAAEAFLDRSTRIGH